MRYSPISRFLLAGALLAFIAGCATQEPVAEGERQRGQWEAQQTELAKLDTWQLAGKVGLRTPEDSTSANLDWNQYPHYFRILISGPFGGGRSVLEGREGRYSLSTAEGRFEADTPQALMEEQLGWSLPVEAMPAWVRGLPGDHATYQLENDALGFPNHLQQDGWEIDYRDWERIDDLWLPRRMILSYGELRVTLVVNEWRLAPEAEAQ